METEPDVHTLASLGECRRQLGLDERDDSLTLFLLIAATYTVENHCRRCLLRKNIREYFDSTGDNALFLREYPVRDVLGVHEDQNHRFMESSLIDPEHYYCTPEISIPEDTIHTLTLIPPYRLQKGTKTIKITYSAGYDLAEVPADLKQAVLELVAWNQTRYRTRRIGVSGSLKGASGQGETPEATIPANVLTLLEPYRRRTL